MSPTYNHVIKIPSTPGDFIQVRRGRTERMPVPFCSVIGKYHLKIAQIIVLSRVFHDFAMSQVGNYWQFFALLVLHLYHET